MAQLKSGFTLASGENLVMELECELWAASSNPIAKMIGEVQRIIMGLLGFKMKGFVIITDKRVVEIGVQTACYIFTIGRQVKYLIPNSIKEVGYIRKAACGLFCPAFYLYYEGHTQATSILLKDADEAQALKTTDAFYAAIAK